MTLIPSLEAVTYLWKLKARNIGIIGFEGFRVHKDGGFTPLLDRTDFSSLLEDTVTWQAFLERSHKESVQVLAREDMHSGPDIAYEFNEFSEEDWKTSKARESMSEESPRTYWGRPTEYSAEFIAHYIERLREAKGPIEECSPLEDLDPQILQQYAISEQNEDVRADLVEIIWQDRRPESVPFLARMLNDPSKKVWKVALDGLVTLGLPVVRGRLGTDAALVALKAARAGASAKQLEYIDEAIDQIDHPKTHIEYLHIKRPYSFTSPFKGAEFVALIYAVDENTTCEEQEAISDQIVISGCRYAVCAGYRSSSWDDSIDMAYLKRNAGEVHDENFVMTSWNDNESLEDIVFFFLFLTSFGYFTAERFVVLLVGEDGSCLSRIRREIEKQVGPQGTRLI